MLAYRVDYSFDGQMSHDEHVTCEPTDGCAGRQHGNPLNGSSLAVSGIDFSETSPVGKKTLQNFGIKLLSKLSLKM